MDKNVCILCKLCPASKALSVVAITLTVMAIALVCMLLFIRKPTADDNISIRSHDGRTIARIVPGYSGGGVARKVIVDGRGARIGSIEKNHGRTTVYLDRRVAREYKGGLFEREDDDEKE